MISIIDERKNLKVSAEEATMEFFGSLVRLDCGDEGVYQGVVVEVDPTNSLIKIEKPFRFLYKSIFFY